MNAKEKATEIANQFVTKSIFEMSDSELAEQRKEAKRCAAICVNQIAIALRTTAGHLELDKGGQFQIGNDVVFWDVDVKNEIDKL